MKKLIVILFVGLLQSSFATTYYVSNAGSSGNSGTSSSSPWNLSKVNSFSFSSGDNILFKKGDTFYGTLTINSSGSSGNPITFGAYGTGAKPLFSGFTSLDSWTNKGDGVYYASLSFAKPMIALLNNNIVTLGRTPNAGSFYYSNSHSGNNQIASSSFSGSTNWTGAEIVMRNEAWIIDRFPVTAQSGGNISFDNTSPVRGTTDNYTPNNGGWFFFQNDIRTLDQVGEWCATGGKFYMYFGGNNPSDYSVKVSTQDYNIDLQYSNNITIKDIDLEGASYTGIYAEDNTGITIENVNSNYQGGHFIFGQLRYTGLIQNCSANNSLAGGIHLDNSQVNIFGCTINNTALNPGNHFSGDGFGGAIGLTGSNDIVSNCIVKNAGYEGIKVMGNNNLVSYNLIDSFCLIKTDGGGIYTSNSLFSNTRIEHNIVLNGIGTSSFDHKPSDANGIYLDNGSRNGSVIGNTIINVKTAGFYYQHDGHSWVMDSNTVYNANGPAVFLCAGYSTDRAHNISMTNNVLVSTSDDSYTLIGEFTTSSQKDSLFKKSDYNVFMRPIDNDGYSISIDSQYRVANMRHPYNLIGWKSACGKDGNSKGSPKFISSKDSMLIVYNPHLTDTLILLPYKYLGSRGNVYDGSIKLAPFASEILIVDGNKTNNVISPTANAGEDRSITLPTNSINLEGSGTDEDGTIASYQWTKISGPNSGAINNANSSSATANNLSEGIYEFELTVTDNKGAVAKDAVEIKVNEAANVAPTANAGIDKSITLPTNTITLNGSGKDEDGTIASYQWTKISGPNSGAIDNANSASATVNNLSEGMYEFELAVTDNKGATAKSTVQVRVNEAVNIAPTATAGNNQTITLPTNTITLNGSGNDTDGTIVSYQWTKISGPTSGAIKNANSASATINNLSEGSYEFELAVTDNKGAVAKDIVKVTVNEADNILPTANAGNNQSITLPTNSVTLSGSGKDEDGNIVSYHWTKISGPNSGAINNANSASATINNLSEGTYEFELTVTDNKGAIAKDAIQVKVNEAANILPTANAGTDKSITLPVNTITLNGSGKDEDGTIASYQWTKISGPNSGTIKNANSASATASNLSEGSYEFELAVTDNKGAVAKDIVKVTVNEADNILPTANAGNNQSITLPTNSVTLSGSGKDEDGNIVSYHWTKISGPNSGAINNANSASATINNLSEGTYEFELTVTDNKGAIAKDAIQVKVNEAANILPTANAGTDKSITLPVNTITLNGSGKDEDGTIASYQWTKISGPNSGTIKNANSASATASNLSEGSYEFELAVTDNKGAVAKDIVKVTVNEADNILPTANAGNNQSITLPTNSVTLSGSGKDEDGNIVSYHWTKISGPNSGAIDNANSASATINNLSEGTYEFELAVTDNKGATAKSTVQVRVNEAVNIAPTATAGNNQTITLPTNTITLNGSGNDTDGTIVSYKWTKISGPNSGTIKNANSSSATASNLSEGTYEFELTVTDNKGAIAKDAIQVKVNEAANILPTANAGTDKSITLPVNTITLNGSGKDEDGNIISYQWTKISGPNSGAIKNTNSSSATASNLSEGTYEFELTVTDNKGAIAKDAIQVKVNEAANILPTANAGNNQSITLPTNTITLNGSGKDEDGNIISYQWTKISGPNSEAIKNANSSSATASNLSEGTYEFELTVTDNKGAIAKDAIQVKVNEAVNILPTANAGTDKSITLPVNTITLNGSGKDEDGTITSYQWTKISGPNSEAIKNANSSSATASNLSEGTYEFELTVTDNKGAIAKDAIQVKVNEAVNILPTANAGTDKSITLPVNTITLNGSGKDEDGTITSYQWTKISGPNSGTINNANSSSATASNLSEGTYEFELTVTDNKGAIAKDAIQVKVNEAANILPTANAGTDKSITLPVNTITLNGSGKDEDGTITSYQWTKISGPNSGAIKNANSSSATASNLSEGTYEFELTVTDNKGAIAKDAIQVKVNEAANILPTANAGTDKSITLPVNTITLNGSGKDEDGTITSYQWTKISGPNSGAIKNANSSSATASNLSEGTYEFELTVIDNKGAIAKDAIQVKVNEAANILPTANAGTDKSITLPVNTITLNGSGKDEDGTIASYQWTKISGPNSGTINNANSSSATVSDLSEGSYEFELAVTDNKGAVAKDIVKVTVNEADNILPTANAGNNQSITLPTNSVTLSGSGKDEDGNIVSYTWKKISGPSDFSLNNSSSATATVSGLVKGTYEFELAVTDNKGAIGKSTVLITVNAADNTAPISKAGTSQTITLPINSITLQGSGEDEDGTIASYQWTKISGPASGTIQNGNSSSATVTSLSEGSYLFELTVRDNSGDEAKDTVQILVNAAANIPPTADAGKDTTILYPASTVILQGDGSDKNGEIAVFSWKQISGPSESVIISPNTSSPEIRELKEGTYQFELLVSDKDGGVAKDTVNVTVALGRLASETENAITVYPNPVHDITTADINTERANTNVLITISDISGKTMYKKQMVSSAENLKEQINMSNFSKGTYVITVFFDNVLRKSIKVLKL